MQATTDIGQTPNSHITSTNQSNVEEEDLLDEETTNTLSGSMNQMMEQENEGNHVSSLNKLGIIIGQLRSLHNLYLYSLSFLITAGDHRK